jgi:hypothetical protein
VAKHAVLDLVPFAGARREMANGNAQPDGIRQPLQRYLPQPGAAAIASPRISGHQ